MRFIRDVVKFVKSLDGRKLSMSILYAVVLFEAIYWSSPEWAKRIGLQTHADYQAYQLTECQELMGKKTEVIHDGGVPIPPLALPEWTPLRVEKRFRSGLTVVSSLGPHSDFQIVVRDLALPEGRYFRIFRGKIVVI